MKMKKNIIKIVVVVFSAVLYGIINKFLSGLLFPGSEIITFRPQLIIPVVVSIIAGPLSGAVVGGVGNVLGDYLLGYGMNYWHWSLANFIIGGVPGLIRYVNIRSIERVNSFAIVLLFVFLANVAGLLVGYGLHQMINTENASLTINSFLLPALISNIYVLLLLLPPVLMFMGFLKMNIETRGMFVVIVISMVVTSLLTIVFLAIEFEQIKFIVSEIPGLDFEIYWNEVIARSLRWIGVVMLFIVIIGIIIGYTFSRRFVRPVYQLSESAMKISKGEWSKGDKLHLSETSSELSNLVEVFNKMAIDIVEREEKMNNTINELRFKIDKAEENKKIEEITESDFFKKIEQKSKEIRQKRKN